jgi:hypothetical protein
MGPSAPQLYSFYDEDIPNLINTHVGTENYLLSPLPVQQNFPATVFAFDVFG